VANPNLFEELHSCTKNKHCTVEPTTWILLSILQRQYPKEVLNKVSFIETYRLALF